MKSSFPYIFCLSLLLTSCQISSRTAVRESSGRESYNITLQRTTNEQMLLNLVRLRYVDFPFFLDVSNVTTQFSFGTKGGGSIPIPGVTEKKPAIISGEVNWQNTPTISYTPLEGQTFAMQLFRPVDLVTIQQLIYAGWDIDRVFRLCIQSIDALPNAPTASGPMPDFEPEFREFFKMTRLLRYFQNTGKLQVGVKVKPDGEFFLGEGLRITFPTEGEEALQLKHLLEKCKKVQSHYVFEVDLGFNKGIEQGIMPRSLMATMYYLSLGVEIPQTHHNSLKSMMTKKESGEHFDWNEVVGDLIHVHSSPTRPTHAFVQVKYRNHWYYIDDCDLQSKRTFVLILQLYNLQSSSPKQAAPMLTLPL